MGMIIIFWVNQAVLVMLYRNLIRISNLQLEASYLEAGQFLYSPMQNKVLSLRKNICRLEMAGEAIKRSLRSLRARI